MTNPIINPINQDESEYIFSLPEFFSMRKDVRNLSVNFDSNSIRKLVQMYYTLQKERIAFAAQARELEAVQSPNELVKYYADSMHVMESSLKYPLERFSETFLVGRWALSQYGIGPVITAGLLGHIDITKARTAGAIWRYAGLDPTIKWEKGQRRPYNAELKTLCWKIGQSFMKFSGKEQCFYGHLYLADKARRTAKNQAGDYAQYAQEMLSTKNYGFNPTRTILESGKLSPGQIDAQARRYAVKIFLSHYHAVAYQDHYGTPAPTPYIIAHGDHVHEISIPNNPF